MFDLRDIQALDEYLDEGVSLEYSRSPLAQDWARVAKVAEEMGEAVDALIGLTGQNPRKGYYGTIDDLYNELVDVALTALLAIQHFTKNPTKTDYLIDNRMHYRKDKAGII
jgi:hypothetical protein